MKRLHETISPAYLAFKAFDLDEDGLYPPIMKVPYLRKFGGYWFLRADVKPNKDNMSGVYAATFEIASKYTHAPMFSYAALRDVSSVLTLVSPSSLVCKDYLSLSNFGWRSYSASVLYQIKNHRNPVNLEEREIQTITLEDAFRLIVHLNESGYPQLEPIVDEATRYLACDPILMYKWATLSTKGRPFWYTDYEYLKTCKPVDLCWIPGLGETVRTVDEFIELSDRFIITDFPRFWVPTDEFYSDKIASIYARNYAYTSRNYGRFVIVWNTLACKVEPAFDEISVPSEREYKNHRNSWKVLEEFPYENFDVLDLLNL